MFLRTACILAGLVMGLVGARVRPCAAQETKPPQSVSSALADRLVAPSSFVVQETWAQSLSDLGTNLLREGRYEEALGFFEAAIAMNSPGIWSRRTAVPPSDLLTQKDLDYGEAELARLLADRPQMNQHGIKETPIYRWAVRRFAGEYELQRITWDPTEPENNFIGLYAEYSVPQGSESPSIRLAKIPRDQNGQPHLALFERLWAGLIFECFNLERAARFQKLSEQSKAGSISKEAYIDGVVRAEFVSAAHQRVFYVTTFLPWAHQAGVESDPNVWHMDRWRVADNWQKLYVNKKHYPWFPYGCYYDWDHANGLHAKGEHHAAAEMAKTLLAEVERNPMSTGLSNAWKFNLNRLLGDCYYYERKYADAVIVLETAKTVAPRPALKPAMDYSIAMCLQALGKHKLALALLEKVASDENTDELTKGNAVLARVLSLRGDGETTAALEECMMFQARFPKHPKVQESKVLTQILLRDLEKQQKSQKK